MYEVKLKIKKLKIEKKRLIRQKKERKLKELKSEIEMLKKNIRAVVGGVVSDKEDNLSVQEEEKKSEEDKEEEVLSLGSIGNDEVGIVMRNFEPKDGLYTIN